MRAPIIKDPEQLKKLEAQALAGIAPDGSLRQLREKLDDSEDGYFMLGISPKRSAYHNVIILGISFEKTRGYWNKRTRSWRYESGRVESLPLALADAIREEASSRMILCRLFYNGVGKVTGLKKVKEADVRTKAGKREIARMPVVYDEENDRPSHEWIPLKDMIILEQTSEHRGRVTTVDVLHSELQKNRERIAELEAQLENAKLVGSQDPEED